MGAASGSRMRTTAFSPPFTGSVETRSVRTRLRCGQGDAAVLSPPPDGDVHAGHHLDPGQAQPGARPRGDPAPVGGRRRRGSATRTSDPVSSMWMSLARRLAASDRMRSTRRTTGADRVARSSSSSGFAAPGAQLLGQRLHEPFEGAAVGQVQRFGHGGGGRYHRLHATPGLELEVVDGGEVQRIRHGQHEGAGADPEGDDLVGPSQLPADHRHRVRLRLQRSGAEGQSELGCQGAGDGLLVRDAHTHQHVTDAKPRSLLGFEGLFQHLLRDRRRFRAEAVRGFEVGGSRHHGADLAWAGGWWRGTVVDAQGAGGPRPPRP